ncbi:MULTISPECIES: hypothetical protein [Candidatus Nitrosocaldus]|uniref:Uncharacterized protein n=1 Tax=Candidatus Nitrosocaldus cavascurensis TaxID=2058097 RepID=A0A2K5ATD7_9ARCH|nr:MULTISPECIES: hypothetical protein [Candidatus Nitrosocaldus]SPC34889.1 protein of unknown function [Candidatus Nitrosocaldus cavascurensis]
MSCKPVIVSMEVTDEADGVVIVIQPSKREAGKISVWLKDYKFGDLSMDEVVRFVAEQLTTILKRAGYETKKTPKVGDTVIFKHDMPDVSAGAKGIIVDIEPDRPYAYLIRVGDVEVFARLEDFELA